jgi:hypothetical protein
MEALVLTTVEVLQAISVYELPERLQTTTVVGGICITMLEVMVGRHPSKPLILIGKQVRESASSQDTVKYHGTTITCRAIGVPTITLEVCLGYDDTVSRSIDELKTGINSRHKLYNCWRRKLFPTRTTKIKGDDSITKW